MMKFTTKLLVLMLLFLSVVGIASAQVLTGGSESEEEVFCVGEEFSVGGELYCGNGEPVQGEVKLSISPSTASLNTNTVVPMGGLYLFFVTASQAGEYTITATAQAPCGKGEKTRSASSSFTVHNCVNGISVDGEGSAGDNGEDNSDSSTGGSSVIVGSDTTVGDGLNVGDGEISGGLTDLPIFTSPFTDDPSTNDNSLCSKTCEDLRNFSWGIGEESPHEAQCPSECPCVPAEMDHGDRVWRCGGTSGKDSSSYYPSFNIDEDLKLFIVPEGEKSPCEEENKEEGSNEESTKDKKVGCVEIRPETEVCTTSGEVKQLSQLNVGSKILVTPNDRCSEVAEDPDKELTLTLKVVKDKNGNLKLEESKPKGIVTSIMEAGVTSALSVYFSGGLLTSTPGELPEPVKKAAEQWREDESFRPPGPNKLDDGIEIQINCDPKGKVSTGDTKKVTSTCRNGNPCCKEFICARVKEGSKGFLGIRASPHVYEWSPRSEDSATPGQCNSNVEGVIFGDRSGSRNQVVYDPNNPSRGVTKGSSILGEGKAGNSGENDSCSPEGKKNNCKYIENWIGEGPTCTYEVCFKGKLTSSQQSGSCNNVCR